MKAMMLVAVALVSLSGPAAAQQSELGGKVRSGREVTIPAGETVQGDLIASGGTVRSPAASSAPPATTARAARSAAASGSTSSSPRRRRRPPWPTGRSTSRSGT